MTLSWFILIFGALAPTWIKFLNIIIEQNLPRSPATIAINHINIFAMKNNLWGGGVLATLEPFAFFNKHFDNGGKQYFDELLFLL